MDRWYYSVYLAATMCNTKLTCLLLVSSFKMAFTQDGIPPPRPGTGMLIGTMIIYIYFDSVEIHIEYYRHTKKHTLFICHLQSS